MKSLVRTTLPAFWTVALSSTLLAASALAQPPAGAPPAGGARPPQPPPTNIKAFPKDINRADLIKYMRQYTGDLGVECEFCHAQNPETHRSDFASDANPKKDRARFMITMTADLNDKLPKMPGGADPNLITCGTCHQGHSEPVAFVPTPRPRPAAPPAAGAPPAN